MRIPHFYGATLILSALVGCTNVESDTPSGQSAVATPSKVEASDHDLRMVQEVLSELLELEPQTIDPETTFAQLQADDLDLVEAVMELEDRLDIRIPDEAIRGVGYPASPQMVLDKLTVRRLAEVVCDARQKP